MRSDLMSALIQIEHDKGLKREVLISAIEEALLSAYRKKFGGSGKNVQVKLNPQTGEIKVFILKKVVALKTKEEDEISLSQAKEIDENYKVDQEITIELAPQDFGRIAAQTAKQVIIQRIHEAERNLLYDEYSQKVGTIVTGVVQRTSSKGAFVDLGKIEGFLPEREQIAKEKYFVGDRIKAYILEIKKTTRTPSAVISRTHPGLIEKLFELEVPEIFDKVVEVKGIARDPGFRTKIAVSSNDGKIDPVGTCVGLRGVRVNAVVKELDGEKIDIIRFSEEIGTFIKNALTPARVERVEIDDKKKRALVVAAKDQLSLAIGRKGQNVRLAAKLTNWHIDVRSLEEITESEAKTEAEAILGGGAESGAKAEVEAILLGGGAESEAKTKAKAILGGKEEVVANLSNLSGVGPKLREILEGAGFLKVEDVASSDISKMCEVPGIGKARAAKLIEEAKKIIE